MKKFIFYILIIINCFLLGCSNTIKEKAFTSSGITITLTEKFVETENSRFALSLQYSDIEVVANAVLKEQITSLRAYSESIFEEEKIYRYYDEITLFDYAYYSNTIGSQEYGYLAVMLEGENHYYIINFICPMSNFDKSSEQFLTWAKTIRVV